MSADLHLLAGPNEPGWRSQWERLNGAQWYGDDPTAHRDDSDRFLVGAGGSRGLDMREHQDRYVPAPFAGITQIVGDGRVLTRGLARESWPR